MGRIRSHLELAIDTDPDRDPRLCRLQGCAELAEVRGLCLPGYKRARNVGRLEELAGPALPRHLRAASRRRGASPWRDTCAAWFAVSAPAGPDTENSSAQVSAPAGP